MKSHLKVNKFKSIMKYTLISFIFVCSALVRLGALEESKEDPLEVQRNIYYMIINEESVDEKIRLIENLSEGLMSELLLVRQQTYRWLYQYDTSLLSSEKIRENISIYLVENNIRGATSIMFKERLDLISEDELSMLASAELEEPNVGRWYGTEAWGATIALASQGKDKYALKAIKRVEAEGSLVLQATRLINHLAKTKHPIAISYIISNYLNSNERLPMVDDARTAVLICKRAAYELSQVLSDFPIKRKYYSDYTLKDISECREWAKTYNYRLIDTPSVDSIIKPHPDQAEVETASENIEFFDSILTEGQDMEANTQEQSSNWLLWLVGPVIAVGGILMIRRKK